MRAAVAGGIHAVAFGSDGSTSRDRAHPQMPRQVIAGSKNDYRHTT